MNKVILAVDIGTSSLKAALIDTTGKILMNTRCRFPQRKRTGQDWLDSFTEALHFLKPQNDLSAIVISGNGPTLIGVDAGGNETDLLLWNDKIHTGSAPIGGMGSVAGESSESPSIFIPRLLAYRSLYSESYARSRWIFSDPEYLIYRLTGNPLTILPESRFERAYWTKDDLETAALDGSKLPPFVPPGTVVGTTGALFSSMSTGISLPTGIPIIAGGPDFIVAIIGTGTLEEGKACDRAGTSEGLNVCVKPHIQHPRIRTLPSVIPGLWNASYLLSETGALFHTYRTESGQTNRSYPEIMAEIESSPLVAQKGELIHPGREVVEKIGFSVRRGIETLQEATGFSPVFFLSGGQARNEIWNQLKADITGAVFAVTATPDGELMGDAIIGAYSLGEYESIQEAARAMVSVKCYYEPDPKKHLHYSEKFALS